MQIFDLIASGAWTARFGRKQCDGPRAASTIERIVCVIERLVPQPDRISVFCVADPIEALLAYGVSSYLGLQAAVVSPQALPGFLGGVDPGLVGLLVVPKGRAARLTPPGVPLTQPDFKVRSSAVRAGGSPRRSRRPARLIFASSGTTGTPKRIVHAEDRLIENARAVAAYLDLSPADRTFCVFPINFMYGLSSTLCTLVSGGHIDFSTFHDPALLAAQADAAGSTVVPVLGDWALRLAAAWADAPKPARRILLNASDRLLRQHALALFPHCSVLWNNFGQMEAGPRLFAARVTPDALEDLCLDGVVAPGFAMNDAIELRLGPDLDSSGFGTLSYRSPYAMLGTLSPQGHLDPAPDWIDSGDLFRREPDGLFRWRSRRVHALKSNGQFVSFREMADRILTHDSITGVGFSKTPSGSLTFYVESDRDQQTLQRQLRSLLSAEAIRYRADFLVLPHLPRTESGKVDSLRLQSLSNGEL